MRLGPLSVEVVDLRKPWVADLAILKRRSYLRCVRLSRHRVLTVGWLPL